MVRRLCLCAVLLASLVIASGAQAQTGHWYNTPQGELYQRSDGSFGYVVSPDDRVGQWQVAFGAPQLWLELVKANPQLADPDLITPGEELNVPTSLVRLFTLMRAAKATVNTPPAPPMSKPDMTAAPAEAKGSFPWWGYALLVIIALLIILWAVSLHHANRRLTKAQSRHDEFRRAQQEREQLRRQADPYSGPPVRENGLPTMEAAEAFFTETYRSQRESLTVADSSTLPPTVHIERIVPVDVRGPMSVRYRHQPQFRNLPNWTPAWQCFFSDGSFLIALMACANDVRAGGGFEPLPATQIRPRQDIPVREVQRQVWPVVAEQTAPETDAIPSHGVVCTSVKVSSPSRYVLHPENGRETVVELGVLCNWVTLGIEGETVYAIIGDERRVIGRIVEPVTEASPAEAAAPPTGDGVTATV